jgi:hypothetical protein
MPRTKLKTTNETRKTPSTNTLNRPNTRQKKPILPGTKGSLQHNHTTGTLKHTTGTTKHSLPNILIRPKPNLINPLIILARDQTQVLLIDLTLTKTY